MKKVLKALGFVLVFALLAIGGVVTWASFTTNAALEKTYDIPPVDLAGANASVEIGKRIVTIRNGCLDCHGEDLSGKLFANDPPFGVIHGPNLTPFGLKDWSDGEIARAIRHGIGRDGHALILMPSHEYNALGRDDLASVVAYLRSLQPIEKQNGPITLGPIAKVLYATGEARTLIAASVIDHGMGFGSKPAEGPTREFGAYLIKSGCVGCHRNDLTGGPIPGAPPDWLPAADISGLKSWNKEQFVKVMREGVRPDGSKVRLPMPLTLTSQLNDTELAAMWEYLKAPDTR